jgi:hypothetical protein
MVPTAGADFMSNRITDQSAAWGTQSLDPPLLNSQMPAQFAVSGKDSIAKAKENERFLSQLGFPDGRGLLALRSKGHERAADQFTREGKGAEADHFTPTLKPDERDWSPAVIKQNYGAWAQRTASEYGLEDSGAKKRDRKQDDDLNAFRHGATAAIFAIKYGPKTALLMGIANEIITKLASKPLATMEERELADTNADLLNNRQGVNIAKTLMASKGKENLTVKDVTDAIAKAVKGGRLITQPLKAWRGENIAPEIKLLGNPLTDH